MFLNYKCVWILFQEVMKFITHHLTTVGTWRFELSPQNARWQNVYRENFFMWNAFLKQDWFNIRSSHRNGVLFDCDGRYPLIKSFSATIFQIIILKFPIRNLKIVLSKSLIADWRFESFILLFGVYSSWFIYYGKLLYFSNRFIYYFIFKTSFWILYQINGLIFRKKDNIQFKLFAKI